VNADELTYHMHIIIRYEIESGLIGGELNVSEIPMVWEEKMEKYLGVIPKNDSEGCLQDIHWSHGSFGYFPTYSVGSVLAAQVNHAMETDIGSIQKLIRQENFECIREWLRENIHNHGGRYTTPDLIEVATNEPIKIDYFVKYVKEKYSGIYGI
jgi:carboxypeptidase Taq